MKLPTLRRVKSNIPASTPTPEWDPPNILPTGLYVLGDMGSRFPPMRKASDPVLPSFASPLAAAPLRASTASAPPSGPSSHPNQSRRAAPVNRPFHATLSTFIPPEAAKAASQPGQYTNHHMQHADGEQAPEAAGTTGAATTTTAPATATNQSLSVNTGAKKQPRIVELASAASLSSSSSLTSPQPPTPPTKDIDATPAFPFPPLASSAPAIPNQPTTTSTTSTSESTVAAAPTAAVNVALRSPSPPASDSVGDSRPPHLRKMTSLPGSSLRSTSSLHTGANPASRVNGTVPRRSPTDPIPGGATEPERENPRAPPNESNQQQQVQQVQQLVPPPGSLALGSNVGQNGNGNGGSNSRSASPTLVETPRSMSPLSVSVSPQASVLRRTRNGSSSNMLSQPSSVSGSTAGRSSRQGSMSSSGHSHGYHSSANHATPSQFEMMTPAPPEKDSSSPRSSTVNSKSSGSTSGLRSLGRRSISLFGSKLGGGGESNGKGSTGASTAGKSPRASGDKSTLMRLSDAFSSKRGSGSKFEDKRATESPSPKPNQNQAPVPASPRPKNVNAAPPPSAWNGPASPRLLPDQPSQPAQPPSRTPARSRSQQELNAPPPPVRGDSLAGKPAAPGPAPAPAPKTVQSSTLPVRTRGGSISGSQPLPPPPATRLLPGVPPSPGPSSVQINPTPGPSTVQRPMNNDLPTRPPQSPLRAAAGPAAPSPSTSPVPRVRSPMRPMPGPQPNAGGPAPPRVMSPPSHAGRPGPGPSNAPMNARPMPPNAPTKSPSLPAPSTYMYPTPPPQSRPVPGPSSVSTPPTPRRQAVLLPTATGNSRAPADPALVQRLNAISRGRSEESDEELQDSIAAAFMNGLGGDDDSDDDESEDHQDAMIKARAKRRGASVRGRANTTGSAPTPGPSGMGQGQPQGRPPAMPSMNPQMARMASPPPPGPQPAVASSMSSRLAAARQATPSRPTGPRTAPAGASQPPQQQMPPGMNAPRPDLSLRSRSPGPRLLPSHTGNAPPAPVPNDGRQNQGRPPPPMVRI